MTPFFNGSSYVKSEQAVDAAYLKLMSENFIYARLNLTPATVHQNHQQLLRFIDSTHFTAFSAQLEKEAEVVRHKKIASHFDIQSITTEHLTCHVQGVLKRSVGLSALPDRPMHYVLRYRYHLGQLSIVQFIEEHTHEKA